MVLNVLTVIFRVTFFDLSVNIFSLSACMLLIDLKFLILHLQFLVLVIICSHPLLKEKPLFSSVAV